MTAHPDGRLLPAPDALREALVTVIADLEKEWRQQRQIIEAEARQAIAEMRADFAEFRATAKADLERRSGEIDAMGATVRELQRQLDETTAAVKGTEA